MKSTQSLLIAMCCLFLTNFLSAQTAVLSFTNPSVSGSKFRVTLTMASAGGDFGIASNNLRFNYSGNSLANPVIVSENFPSPDFDATTTNGSTYSSFQQAYIASINTPYYGVTNSGVLPIIASGIDLVVVEFDIINPNSTAELTWRYDPVTALQPKTAIVDDDKLTPRLISSATNLTGFSLLANYGTSFRQAAVSGSKFSVQLNVKSGCCQSFSMGTSNLCFNYNKLALANPVIKSTAFPTPAFGTSTTTGSVPASGIFNVSTTYSGTANANILPINATGVDVVTVEFDVINPSLSSGLTWRLTGSPKTTVMDDNKVTNLSNVSLTNLDVSTKSVNAGTDVTVNCGTNSVTLTATDGTNYLWSTGQTTASITVSPNATTTYAVTSTNGSTSIDEVTVFYECNAVVKAKVFLNNINPNTLLMDNYVATLANFPLSDPYANGAFNGSFTHVNNSTIASINQNILAVTGNDAIVDWVFLELRTGISGSTSVAYTKAALLQADGDIVDMDGVSPVKFVGATPGNYYVTIRHRNSLGFRTNSTIALSGTAANLDFTSGSTTLHGTTPLYQISPNLLVMNTGDSNADGSVDAFDTIIWEQQNGLFDDYSKNADYNMDGSVDAFDSIQWELNNGKFEELD
jgi:hypothetical protein